MMKTAALRIVWPQILIAFMTFLITQCAASREEIHDHGKMPVAADSKDHVYPLSEVNFQRLAKENQGLQIVLENATTVNDYYRGGVQEKELGESLLKAAKWEEARIHLEKSNQLLRVVVNYLPEDEAQRNIYGSHKVIFLPNLLMADNHLKLASIDRKAGKEQQAAESEKIGKGYLAKSVNYTKTEWGIQVQKEYENLPKK